MVLTAFEEDILPLKIRFPFTVYSAASALLYDCAGRLTVTFPPLFATIDGAFARLCAPRYDTPVVFISGRRKVSVTSAVTVISSVLVLHTTPSKATHAGGDALTAASTLTLIGTLAVSASCANAAPASPNAINNILKAKRFMLYSLPPPYRIVRKLFSNLKFFYCFPQKYHRNFYFHHQSAPTPFRYSNYSPSSHNPQG